MTGKQHDHSSHSLTDHKQIKQWAEKRNAKPSRVIGTEGMLRFDLPGYTGRDSLEEISWEQWFEIFDSRELALLVQEETAGGKRSNFNKLVARRK